MGINRGVAIAIATIIYLLTNDYNFSSPALLVINFLILIYYELVEIKLKILK